MRSRRPVANRTTCRRVVAGHNAAVSSDQIVVGVAVLVAATVYVVVGFGFALLAMPLMTLTIPVERAVVVLSLLAVFMTGTQAWTLRSHVRRALATRLVVAAFAGMPFGLVLLDTVEERILQIVLGVAVVVATIVLARDVTLDHTGPSLDVAAGFVSGIASTSIGTNGPPLVFDLQSRRLGPDEFRGTLAVVFTLGNLFSLVLFTGSGKVTGDGLTVAAIALPALVAGTLAGRALQPHVPPRRLRSLVLGLLLVTGVVVIARAI